MLRLIDNGSAHDSAYLVPFVVDRSRAPRFDLYNRGDERLRGIRLTLLGSGRLLWGLPTTLESGESLRFAVHGDDIARGCVLVVRWFRPSDDEYLWRMSF